MSIAAHWIAWGTLGSASIVAVAAVALPPPPVEARAAIVSAAAVSNPSALATNDTAGEACARIVWPMVDPACGTSAARPASVRVIDVAAADRAVAGMPVRRIVSAASPALGARVAVAPVKLAEAAPAVAAKPARAEKRRVAARPTREARRGSVVRVSLCRTGDCGAAPVAAPRPAPAFAYAIGPRVDR